MFRGVFYKKQLALNNPVAQFSIIVVNAKRRESQCSTLNITNELKRSYLMMLLWTESLLFFVWHIASPVWCKILTHDYWYICFKRRHMKVPIVHFSNNVIFQFERATCCPCVKSKVKQLILILLMLQALSDINCANTIMPKHGFVCNWY